MTLSMAVQPDPDIGYAIKYMGNVLPKLEVRLVLMRFLAELRIRISGVL